MVGNKIKELRIQNRLTQDELAKALNISRSSIAMFESNQRTPSRNSYIALAKFFNVPIEVLLDDSSSIPKDVITLKPEVQTLAIYLNTKIITEQKITLLKQYIDALFDEEV